MLGLSRRLIDGARRVAHPGVERVSTRHAEGVRHDCVQVNSVRSTNWKAATADVEFSTTANGAFRRSSVCRRASVSFARTLLSSDQPAYSLARRRSVPFDRGVNGYCRHPRALVTCSLADSPLTPSLVRRLRSFCEARLVAPAAGLPWRTSLPTRQRTLPAAHNLDPAEDAPDRKSVV